MGKIVGLAGTWDEGQRWRLVERMLEVAQGATLPQTRRLDGLGACLGACDRGEPATYAAGSTPRTFSSALRYLSSEPPNPGIILRKTALVCEITGPLPGAEKVISSTKKVNSSVMQSLKVSIHSGAPGCSSGGGGFLVNPIIQ